MSIELKTNILSLWDTNRKLGRIIIASFNGILWKIHTKRQPHSSCMSNLFLFHPYMLKQLIIITIIDSDSDEFCPHLLTIMLQYWWRRGYFAMRREYFMNELLINSLEHLTLYGKCLITQSLLVSGRGGGVSSLHFMRSRPVQLGWAASFSS